MGSSLSLLKYIGRVHLFVVARALKPSLLTHGVTATSQNKNRRAPARFIPTGLSRVILS